MQMSSQPVSIIGGVHWDVTINCEDLMNQKENEFLINLIIIIIY